MNFDIRITLPEAPDENLAERISITGFISPCDDRKSHKAERDIIKRQFADALVSEGIIPINRQSDLIFEFGSY